MTLELRLFGGLELADARGPIELSAKKARALLAFLAAQPGRRHAREQLAALLWGDVSADEQARRSLRQALTVLRRALPEGVLDSGRDDIGLGSAPLRVDVVDFVAALEQGDRDALRRAVALYRGELLEGFGVPADGFYEWVTGERARLRELALGAMERLCRLERDAGLLEAAIALAMRVVALEPLRESAQRELMELYAAAAAPGRALQQYDRYRELLERELGIAPSAETARLAARIRAAETIEPPREPPPQPRATAPASPLLRHVVVVHVTAAWEQRRGDGYEAIQRALTRFGGRVFRDSRDALAAVYGAVPAPGGIVDRAVHAALAVRELLSERELPVRIGVAAGLALVAELSDGLEVHGEVVSHAACLHEVGSLVISQAVRDHLGERAEARERARVRGAAAYELAALRSDPGAERTVLLGRDFELAQLVAGLEPCMALGRGRSYLVRGEAGIGKSRLVAHFCQQAQRSGFEVHCQHTLDFGRGMELDLGEALARDLLLDAPREDLDDALARALVRGELAAADLGFARRLMGAGRGELDAGPDEVQRREHAILAKLLQARSNRRPQLLWVEDVHWAHPAALRQLAHLMGVVAECRALLVMTTRIAGEPDERVWRQAVKGRAVSTIDLAPLAEPVAHALVRYLCEQGAAIGDAAAIVQRAGGNPLFIEQLARAGAAEGVPGSVQALVQARTDALDDSSRSVLQAASVLGQRLEEAALARLVGASRVVLAELFDQGLLVAQADGAAFAHALVRDAVYASLPDERRRALHLAAADYYADRDVLLRAEHLERAAAPEAASAYALAAEQQRLRGALERALELCQRGAALATGADDALRLALLRGEILRELGRADDALEAFAAARDHSRSDRQRAQAWLGTASVYRLLDRQLQALGALEQALGLLDPEVAPELVSQIHNMRGNVLFPSGDAEACLKEHQRALELARRARSPLAEAQAISGIADTHYVAGRMRSAAQMFERCEALAAREGFEALERSSRGMRLYIQLFSLCVREAAERCLEEAARAERAGALKTVAFLGTGACSALGFLGEWQRMATLAQRVAELTHRIGAQRFEALALSYLAMARLQLEPGHDASGELARALKLAMASGMAFGGGAVHAVIVTATDEPQAKRREVRRGLAALKAGSFAHGRIMFLQVAMAAMIRLRDGAQARQLADELAQSQLEPCEMVRLFVDLGRTAAEVLAAPDAVGSRQRLAQIRQQAAQRGLMPTVALLDDLLHG